MAERIIPVILAGGGGTRLWPLSRTATPKPFIQIVDSETLFQKALLCVADASIYDAPTVIANRDLRFAVAEQAREIQIELTAVLLEPVPRNTAAAIAAAAIWLRRRFGENVILQFLTSDQEITAGQNCREAIATAFEAAAAGRIVTFGIPPTGSTGDCGQIKRSQALQSGAHQVKRFVEKPQPVSAPDAPVEGIHIWNSGVFLSRADVLLGEFQAVAPNVYAAAQMAVDHAVSDADFVRLDHEHFSRSPDLSIDRAVLEKTSNAAVIAADFTWPKLRGWDAVWQTGKKDFRDNVVIGHATVVNTDNSLVLSHSLHLAVQGLADAAVVASEDAVFVGRLDEAQQIGKLVKHLAENPTTSILTETHPTSRHPWGRLTSVVSDDRFKVKRLVMPPGACLPPRKHLHRSEHWICVKGTSEVSVRDTMMSVGENQSVYIPQGEWHQLRNPGRIAVDMIIIQMGSNFEEDEIEHAVDETSNETD